MVSVYPIVITPDDGWYVVYVPDLKINTQGKGLGEAIFMARDAIGMWACCQLDNNRPIPRPNTEKIEKETPQDIITLVDIDIDAYRQKHETRTVRRNITLPHWVDYAAKQANINVSQLAQNAIKQELQLEQPPRA